MTDREFIQREIAAWKRSSHCLMQIKGHLYYDGEHDILGRKRTVIGDKGELTEVENLPNNRIVDNQYGKLVNQKANYLLGQPFVIESDNKQYAELLKEIFNKRFMRMLKNAGKAALNGGIAWLYPYYNELGEFGFRMFPGYEILPFWKDSEHTVLEAAIRLYQVEAYEGNVHKLVEKIEIYDLQGVHCFILDNGSLVPDSDVKECDCAYVNGSGKPLNWEKIPLIAIKYNERKTPLIKKVKTLQDGINVMLSDFENNMQEDARNTILVLKNYDGTNLGEFRRNLATYGAVKVRCYGDANGGVESLEIEVNSANYKAMNIITGADPQKAIDAIAKKMNTSKSNAGRLVMTEEAYFSSAAQGKSYHDLGVEQYEVLATLDDATSEICQNLDSKVFDMKDYKAGVTAPPFHVRCRSTTVPHLDEEIWGVGERAAWGKDGKTYYVPDNIAYPEWREKFVNGGEKSDNVDKSGNSGIINEKSKKPITPITDKAINSVPKVQISGYTAKQCDFIQQQHKELLKYAREENGCNEIAFVFRKGLSDRTAFTGSDDKLDFGSGLLGKGDELFIMHNHPRNSSYSITDMILLLSNENIQSLSIVKNDGNIEIPTKLKNFDALEIKKDFQRIIKKTVKTGNDEEYNKAVLKLLKKCSAEGEMLEWKR